MHAQLLENRESQECREPLPVRRTLPHPYATIRNGNRVVPRRFVPGEVVSRQRTAVLPSGRRDRVGDRTLVERGATVHGDPFEHASEPGVTEYFPGVRRAPVQRELTRTKLSEISLPRGGSD